MGRVFPWFLLNLIIFAVLVALDFWLSPKPSWWKDSHPLLMNLLSGGLVSFFFYWLVVYLPDKRRRHIIRSHFSQYYTAIKKDILYQVVFASQKGGRDDLQADTETISNLMTVEGFKDTFARGRMGGEGFYAFQNQMSDETFEFRAIVMNIELLAKQIEFVLQNYVIDDENVFTFFKGLEGMLFSLKNSDAGYDASKPLCRFVYQMYSGWSPVDGYLGYDAIEKMISEI